MKPFTIKTPRGDRTIGPGHPTFIIAELSGNHNQSYERAVQLIDKAVEAGVDAIKLQTYTPDTMTLDCDKEYFIVKSNNDWNGQKLYDLYQTAYTPWDWQPKLKEYAEQKGILLFSTPFDESAVDFLEKMNVSLYKVASFEVTDLPLLKKVGATRKPVIISRGMASFEELQEAISTLKEAGTEHLVVLHCVSAYPATLEQMNLTTIPDLAQRFNVLTGLSDHSLEVLTALLSVSLGSCVIEKHFTLKRADGGPDASFSLEPEEMKEMVNLVRKAEKALGKPYYGLNVDEKKMKLFRRSLFAVENIKAGEILTEKNVRIIRPAHGLEPKYSEQVIGKKALRDLERGTPISWKILE